MPAQTGIHFKLYKKCRMTNNEIQMLMMLFYMFYPSFVIRYSLVDYSNKNSTGFPKAGMTEKNLVPLQDYQNYYFWKFIQFVLNKNGQKYL